MGLIHLYVCASLAVLIGAIEIPQYAYHEIEDKAAPVHKKPPIPIVKQSFEQSKDGYQYSYETGNGIHAEESGYIKNKGDKKHEILVQQGTITYHDEHGNPITLSYVADEKGFRPQGDHLPTPPPIPDEIMKSLEINAQQAQTDQKEEYQYQEQREEEEPEENENSQQELLQREYQNKLQEQIQKQLLQQQYQKQLQYQPHPLYQQQQQNQLQEHYRTQRQQQPQRNYQLQEQHQAPQRQQERNHQYQGY